MSYTPDEQRFDIDTLLKEIERFENVTMTRAKSRDWNNSHLDNLYVIVDLLTQAKRLIIKENL